MIVDLTDALVRVYEPERPGVWIRTLGLENDKAGYVTCKDDRLIREEMHEGSRVLLAGYYSLTSLPTHDEVYECQHVWGKFTLDNIAFVERRAELRVTKGWLEVWCDHMGLLGVQVSELPQPDAGIPWWDTEDPV